MRFKLLCVAVASIAFISFGSEKAFAAKYANSHFLVESSWLSKHLHDPGLRILDVRKLKDYEQGHLPNAIHLDRADVSAVVKGVRGMLAPIGEVERVLGEKGINRQSNVIIYDYTTGPAAARVFWILDYIGHKNMALLNGGWTKWTREGREVNQKIPEPTATQYQASPEAQKLATGLWIFENLKNHNIAILDVRSHDEFTGRVAGSSRGGHIPGAIHLEWKKNLTEQGTIKRASDLRNMFYRAQIKKGKEIVVHCQTGVRGAQSYFVLRLLGYDQVRLYDGSWEEWGNHGRYPVETGIGKAIHKTAPTC